MEQKTIARWAGIDHRDGHTFIKIMFPFNPQDLDRVRSLSNRKWHPEGKFWLAPFNIDAAEKLQAWGFTLGPKLIEKMHKVREPIPITQELVIPGLKGTLYPFQRQGVLFVEHHQGNALIADEMGTGKTIQALAWLQLHPELRPVVIVVPASLKLNWEREAQRWMDAPKTQVISGITPYNLHGEIIIVNYDILTYWVTALAALHLKVLITDECHYYKSNATKRTKAVKRLGKNIPHVIALSGTPIVNRPIEAYNAIKLIDAAVLPDFWTFAMHYCGARNNGFGWDFSGATNTHELHELLTRTVMIRRLKKDVLPDLPDKVRSFVPIELDNNREYDLAETDFIAYIQATKGHDAARRAESVKALAQVEGLKQLAVHGKLKQAIEWIQDFLEINGKLVVFATHTFVIDALMNTFRDIAVKVDGSVTGEHRQLAVDEFQNNDNVRLFIGNIQAAGVGITLTAASNVAFLELPWTPGAVTQAEDRVHRIGQKDSVNIHYLLAVGTIEERIAHLIDKKRKVLDSVLDGKDTDVESLLSELMKEYE